MAIAPSTQASTPSPKSTSNLITTGDHPDHRFQVNNDLLYEREFERGAFVSAHLQRLQNGCFTDSKLHTKDTLHVTFAAITFTFHPVTSSGSSDHRFESAVIEIVAKSNGLPLRFLKHAPHMAFGRISSSNLKWNFSLGASIGVSSSPAKADINPSVEYERDTVVGTMMKIQGSTRSTQLDVKDAVTHAITPARIPDTRLVWTLEENTQQKAGIPREFTFVFLMERPVPSLPKRQHKPQSLQIESQPAPKPRSHSIISSSVCSTPIQERHLNDFAGSEILVEQSVGIEMVSEKAEYNFFLSVPEPVEHTRQPGIGMIDNIRAEADHLAQKLHFHNQVSQSNNIVAKVDTQQQYDDLYNSVFKEITFSITVKPDIANTVVPKSLFEHHAQHSTVYGEVGQRFSAMSENYVQSGSVEVNGLYNFTKLPVNFEDLIELPGSTISTVEPTLPPGGGRED